MMQDDTRQTARDDGDTARDGDILQPTTFYAALARSLASRGLRLEEVRPPGDAVARRVLEEYGAMFVAAASVRVPPCAVFTSRAEVARFQQEATFRAADFGTAMVELQPAALAALLAARDAARSEGFDITPRDGAEAGRRSFDDTLRLWDSRFLPALDYWCAQGRLAPEVAARLRTLTPDEQVVEVLELERDGIYFSKDFSKSVLLSVAAPGASQHLSMLAFDAVEFREPVVRRALARHGWFQTVRSDLPHFTFLGHTEAALPAHGLRRLEDHGQIFWIPNLDES